MNATEPRRCEIKIGSANGFVPQVMRHYLALDPRRHIASPRHNAINVWTTAFTTKFYKYIPIKPSTITSGRTPSYKDRALRCDFSSMICMKCIQPGLSSLNSNTFCAKKTYKFVSFWNFSSMVLFNIKLSIATDAACNLNPDNYFAYISTMYWHELSGWLYLIIYSVHGNECLIMNILWNCFSGFENNALYLKKNVL